MTIDSTRKDDPCGPGKLLAPIRSTRLRTSVPGPVAQVALERAGRVMNSSRTANSQLPLVVQKAHGALVYDVDGNVFIDFACVMLPTGHTPDSTLTALRNGAETLLYYKDEFGVAEIALQVCESLNALAPFKPAKTVLYDSTFETRSLIRLHHMAETWPTSSLELSLLSNAKGVLLNIMDADTLDLPSQEAIDEIVEGCKQRNLALFIDETFTGLGRTGKLFAYQHFGIEADGVLIGRGAAAGLPFAALIGRADFIDSFSVDSLGASALSCAAAVETINAIVRDDLPNRAVQVEALIRERVEEWKMQYSWLGTLHGVGLALALDVGDFQRAIVLQNACLQRGLILHQVLQHSECLHLLPPLMIPEEQLHEGLDILEAALGAV